MKHFARYSFLLLLISSLVSAQTATKFVCTSDIPKTTSDFREWLSGIKLIMTFAEEEKLSQLKSDDACRKFIKDFWKRRDPNPVTSANEFRDEYCQRIEQTERFTSGIPGWKTDRGRTYLLFGKPEHVERGRADLENLKGIPYETWTYGHVDWLGEDIKITFIDPTESNEYRFSLADLEKMTKTFENSRRGLTISMRPPVKN